LAAADAGDLKGMPNPLELLTKPLQIAFGVLNAVKGLVSGGDDHQEPPRQPHQDLQREQQAQQRRAPQPKPLDDATITDKVETILFRDQSVAKGKIDVNTVDGVVYLRGVAKTPEQIKALEAKALDIPEVKQVENLLHLPKTPAQKKTRRSTGTAAARKRAPKRTTSERKTPATPKEEPTPKALAAAREGRKPAPLGSSDNGGGGTSGSSGSGS
jgi:hypothetical protein